MNSGFGRRCEAALIHPVTVAALVVLLLNDLVFKSVWPDSWVTGKLSDLAWVVFASPLLAFLLSLLVGKSAAGQRVAFFASYVGLPLLYAAYNTFDPVYYWIIRGLSVASGGTAGSPQDVTDSVVIPVGLCIAVWVWRRGAAGAEGPRLRWAILMAGVAALASVATSYPDRDAGIQRVGVAGDGVIYAGRQRTAEYRSLDGGASWDRGSIDWFRGGGSRAKTPRGTYTIEGPYINLLGTDGESRVAYSSAYLLQEANLWTQKRASYMDASVLARGPTSIVYDERSGNVVAAMGNQGVVVGTPDGMWTRYAVGGYSPTDFSFTAKTRLLLSTAGFWAASLALSLSMTGFVLVAFQFRQEDLRKLAAVPIFTLGLLTLPVVLVATRLLLLVAFGWVPLVTTDPLMVVIVAFGILSSDPMTRKTAGFVVGTSSVLMSCLLVLTLFSDSSANPTGFFDYDPVRLLSLMAAFVLGISAVGISRHWPTDWPAVLGAALGMNVVVVLAFILWLHLGIAIATARVSSIVLVALTALVLMGYLKWQEHRE